MEKEQKERVEKIASLIVASYFQRNSSLDTKTIAKKSIEMAVELINQIDKL